MTLEELFAKGPYWAMNTTDGRKAFAFIYKKFTGAEVCSTCPGIIYQKYFELKNVHNQNQQPERKFIMMPGVLIHMLNGCDYTDKTITDSQAIELINLNAAYRKYFLKIDEEALINNK